MQVKLLDYGVPSEMQPKRAHANDVGADVYALKDRIIEAGCSAVIGLGFGLDLPAGFGAFIFLDVVHFRLLCIILLRYYCIIFCFMLQSAHEDYLTRE